MRLALKARWLMLAAIMAAPNPAAMSQDKDPGTLLLDLTKPVPMEEKLTAMPGASVTASEGQPLPRGYPLPLAVRLLSISPQPVRIGRKFTVEILLRNTGDAPFDLPASQYSRKVLKQGNNGRRTFLFLLTLQNPTNGRQSTQLMASSNLSQRVPSSLLHLEPGQRVRVLFTGDLSPFADLLRNGLEQVQVRAQVSEWKFEDRRYFIEREAEPVLSDNTVMLDIGPIG
jgi:hypothetical protein